MTGTGTAQMNLYEIECGGAKYRVASLSLAAAMECFREHYDVLADEVWSVKLVASIHIIDARVIAQILKK